MLYYNINLKPLVIHISLINKNYLYVTLLYYKIIIRDIETIEVFRKNSKSFFNFYTIKLNNKN